MEIHNEIQIKKRKSMTFNNIINILVAVLYTWYIIDL